MEPFYILCRFDDRTAPHVTLSHNRAQEWLEEEEKYKFEHYVLILDQKTGTASDVVGKWMRLHSDPTRVIAKQQ